jgi:hypothetical protein
LDRYVRTIMRYERRSRIHCEPRSRDALVFVVGGYTLQVWRVTSTGSKWTGPDKGPIINKTIAARARLVIDGHCQKLGVM